MQCPIPVFSRWIVNENSSNQNIYTQNCSAYFRDCIYQAHLKQYYLILILTIWHNHSHQKCIWYISATTRHEWHGSGITSHRYEYCSTADITIVVHRHRSSHGKTFEIHGPWSGFCKSHTLACNQCLLTVPIVLIFAPYETETPSLFDGIPFYIHWFSLGINSWLYFLRLAVMVVLLQASTNFTGQSLDVI